MAKYTVRQGECIESIAYENGLFWETVWNDAENAELKRVRKSPNCLLAGDEVFIPEKRETQVPGSTERRHRFKRKGVPSKLHIIVKKEDEPRAKEPYTLEIDGELFSGTTNAQGAAEHSIAPNAKSGKLTVGQGRNTQEYELQLGHEDPITELTGIQHRLNNLGFYGGPFDGQMSPGTIQGLKGFQKRMGLPASGEIDQATRDAIEQEHGS